MTATATRTAFAPTLSASPTARRATTPLRLTRRGRLLLTALAVLVLFAVLSIGRAGSQAATVTQTGPTLTQATVLPGDTLWSVAQRLAPDHDTRAVVEQIKRLNDLRGSGLQAGQQLLLPTVR